MKMSVEDVTPDVAEDWLGKNTHNRTLKKRAVATYADDMRNGEWQLNGEAIKFAKDGTLLDGQNRLHAVIEADLEQPVKMLVVRGLESGAQEVMDTGTKRTFGDVLKLRGESNWVGLAAITKQVHLWSRGSRPSSGSPLVSVPNMLKTLDEHPELRDIASRTSFISQRCNAPASIIGLTMWLFEQIDAEDAEHFFERLSSEVGHEEGHPIYTLRRTLARRQEPGSAHAMHTRRMMTAYIIKAWNAYRKGEDVQVLRFSPGGARPEKFPEPI